MTNVLNILCKIKIFDTNDLPLPQADTPAEVIAIAFTVLLITGLAFLIYWLAATSFGRTALDNSSPRRNAMALYTPLIPFGVWIFLSAITGGVLGKMKGRLADWQQELLVLTLTGAVAAAMVGMTVVIVRWYFVRSFKGFGLAPKTIGNDCVGAIATLLAVWPRRRRGAGRPAFCLSPISCPRRAPAAPCSWPRSIRSMQPGGRRKRLRASPALGASGARLPSWPCRWRRVGVACPVAQRPQPRRSRKAPRASHSSPVRCPDRRARARPERPQRP